MNHIILATNSMSQGKLIIWVHSQSYNITLIKIEQNKYKILLFFRRSELNTTREKSSRDQRERPNNEKYKRRSEIDNREYYKRGDEYRRDRDYRKGYSTHHPTRGYR